MCLRYRLYCPLRPFQPVSRRGEERWESKIERWAGDQRPLPDFHFSPITNPNGPFLDEYCM